MSGPLFILAGNGPYDNRGCEAIVRGTVAVLRRHFESPRFLACSQFLSQEHLETQRKIETDPSIHHVKMNRLPNFPQNRLLNSVWWRFCKAFPSARRSFIYKEMLSAIPQAEAVLSVGGDNYGLDYGSLQIFTDLDDLIESRGAKLAIWGASVGPFDKDPVLEKRMSGHLKRQAAVFVRESRTMDYLGRIGVTQNVHETADPAFVMEPQEPADAGDLASVDGAVGLNFSPLMARYVSGGDLAAFRSLCAAILRGLLEDTKRPVLLVPHVMNAQKDRDDHHFMKGIVEAVGSERVRLLPPRYNAAETKWFIARCHVFAGARTHATIAAFSSEVPTLSFGYSFKAEGLNRDIFGHLDYCVRAQDFSEATIRQVFRRLLKDRENIRAAMRPVVARMKERAFESGAALKKICEQVRVR